MKMKNEEEKNEDFFGWAKNFEFILLEYLNLADSKSVLRFLIFLLDQKL